MRKVKFELQCRIPSWHFCNYDGFTADNRFSKELCKFCVKTKDGHRCLLFDQELTSDSRFVNKTCGCIEASAANGYEIAAAPSVDPKLVIKETIKSYKQAVEDLIKQGYPRNLAETLATKYMLDER